MKFYYVIALFFSCCVPFQSNAIVDYISLHDIEVNTHEALSVKLNIVEKGKSQLKFIIQNSESESELSYQRVNNYMLRLTGKSGVQNNAVIIVQQKVNNVWQNVKVISLKPDLLASDKNIKKHLITKQEKTPTHLIQQQTTSSELGHSCRLISQPNETLWRLAQRYSKQWDLDIYSTMIAIYIQNINQFSQRHIKLLKANASLTCPRKQIVNTLESKALMKHEFHRLHNKPTKRS